MTDWLILQCTRLWQAEQLVDKGPKGQRILLQKMYFPIWQIFGHQVSQLQYYKPDIIFMIFERRGKSANSKKKSSSAWEWDEQQDALIQTLGQLMQLDVNRLWDPPIVEEEFVKYACRNIAYVQYRAFTLNCFWYIFCNFVSNMFYFFSCVLCMLSSAVKICGQILTNIYCLLV